MKTNLKIVAISILASILLVPAVQTNVFADEPGNIRPEFKKFELPQSGTLVQDAINNVGIRAVFHFQAGEEIVDSFKSFSTRSTGFDRARGITTVELQGLISNDKPLLYAAVDKAYYIGTSKNVQHDFKIFDFDILFTHGEQMYRGFVYENCIIKDYNIDTLFDREETYMAKTKFAYVENTQFECGGVSMLNPIYDQMKEDQKKELTAATLAKMKVKNGLK